jgi:hypothetical protein
VRLGVKDQKLEQGRAPPLGTEITVYFPSQYATFTRKTFVG